MFYKYFQRITTSNKFIAEIDGLRFIAIMSVVLYHLSLVIASQNTHSYTNGGKDGGWEKYFVHGKYGVQLFFAISGFILALPFAKHYLTGAQKPTLEQYYMRRLTRLEPTYFIVMIGLFFYILLVQHTFSFRELFPSLLASLTYTNNFAFGNSVLPYVNSVAWTLEIEVQFYLIAPVLAFLLFSIKSPWKRKIVISGLIALFILLQLFIKLPFRSLYNQIQYFLIGFLLADFYISGIKVRIPAIVGIIIGLLALIEIFAYEPGKQGPIAFQFFGNLFFASMITVFCFLALLAGFWKSVLSNKFLVTIGGMCYTIYLLHMHIMAIVCYYTIRYSFSKTYAVDWLIQAIILLAVTLACSSVFFILIERPCMNKDWYKKFILIFKRSKSLQVS